MEPPHETLAGTVRFRGAGSRVDPNQRALVKALRAAGASVVSLASIGRGCPDLLVGYRGMTFLVELKRDAKAYSSGTGARVAHENQVAFAAAWRGGRILEAVGADVKPLLDQMDAIADSRPGRWLMDERAPA